MHARALIAAALVAGVSAACADRQANDAALDTPANIPAAFHGPPEWTQAAEPFRIIGNVYYVGSAGLAAYLIATPDGLILLDGGLPAVAPIIESNIQALGYKLSDVKFLANSHAHLDHAGGLAQLKKDTGATLVAAALDQPLLESGTYPGDEQNTALQFPAVNVDRAIADGERLTLGKTTLTAHITPGHTPGCTSWTMPVEEQGKTHTIIFFCSASVAANTLVGPRITYPNIVADYEKTFREARKIKADVFLAPHAEMFDLAAKRAAIAPDKPNPFIKPGEFEAYLDKTEADFRAQLASQEAALKTSTEQK